MLSQSADRIIGKNGHDGRAQTETAPQSTGDVILAASFPHAKFPRGRDSNIARIEAQHHFPQADQIPSEPSASFTRKALFVSAVTFVASPSS